MKLSRLLPALILFGALGTDAPRAQQVPGGGTQAQPCEPGARCAVRPDARQKARKTKAKTSKAAKPAVAPPEQKKADAGERTPYDEHDAEAAILPGLPGVRFWGDSFGAFAHELPSQRGPWLVLSSGGSSGAYGAGVLVGLSQAGKRPEFSVVTGVSIGAVMAPYAFLGPKYDDQLRDGFLSLTSADVFEDAVRPDSLVDTWPLKKSLEKRVTPELLADIAVEHRKGRRLFVITANLDSERPVVWNMGAIAAHGGEAALMLFRQVLLAASAIPGIFPPVLIDVEGNGKKFSEMHADGGVFGPFFVAPSTWLVEPGSDQLPADKLYLIIHSKLVPEFELTDPEKIFILGRMISGAEKAGMHAELALLSNAAKRDGIELNVAYVDAAFRVPAQTTFDQKQMTALFDLGLEQAKNGTAFRTQSPSTGQAQTK
jgi:hypothetical protein